MRSIVLLMSLLFSNFVDAQDSTFIQSQLKNRVLKNNINYPKDSISFRVPKLKQGIICDFEDKLNRKKIPLNFSVGNFKY